MLDLWTVAAIAAKFLLYLGLLSASGAVVVSWLFRLTPDRKRVLTYAMLALVAAGLTFLVRGANLTGDASGLTDPMILGLLWETPVGTALICRVVGLLLLAIGLFVRPWGLWLSVLGGVVALWSFDFVGHIASQNAVILDAILIFHLVALSFWIGILAPLKRLTTAPDRYAEAAQLGERFGHVAAVIVPALIIAGGYMGYRLTGSLAALVGTAYGQVLMLKILLVAILLTLAAANKWRFVPKLKRRDPAAARHLATSLSVEWSVVLGVFLVTAVLTTNVTPPV